MKILYFIIGIILIGVLSFIIYKSKEDYDIYSSFRKNLNYINKLVRKNNWEYYDTDTKVKNWILSIINEVDCKNIFVSPNLYYGHPDLEFNYSHTMSDKIILSNNHYKQLQKYYNKDDKNAVYDIGSLIVHESVHIAQRFNYQKFKNLYKLWGYEFGNIKKFDHILGTKRQNPDADDDNVVWANNNKYYFINCFYDKNNPNISVTKYAYPLLKIENEFIYNGSDPILLNNLDSYNNFFGHISNNYTPNEICAEYTEIIFSTCLVGKTNFNSDAFSIFKNYFDY